MVWSPIATAVVGEGASSWEGVLSETITSGDVEALAPIWALGGMSSGTGLSTLDVVGTRLLVGVMVISREPFRMGMAWSAALEDPSQVLFQLRAFDDSASLQ